MAVAWAISQAKRKKEDDERAAAREAAAEARKAEMLRILAEQVAEKVPNSHPHTDSLHPRNRCPAFAHAPSLPHQII